jgi:uncharacterized SAM-dependent methyltransferase/class 3 adenylate cyclase
MGTKADNEFPTRVAAFFFLDIVGLSRKTLTTDKQVKKIRVLTESIEQCEAFRKALDKVRLILPTGDGLAIDFGDQFQSAFELAIQLESKLKSYNAEQKESEKIYVRIGIHMGSVLELKDIRNNLNVWGEGIITARRIMDLGDENHILLSEMMAEGIRSVSEKHKKAIHKLGNFAIKHGETISVYSAYTDQYGNPNPPLGESSELTLVNDFRNGIATESFVTVWADRDIKEKEILENLVRSVEDTRRIDQSYLYWESSAARRWKRICEDPSYVLHQISKNLVKRDIKDMLGSVIEDTGNRVFDFVNLGTGGGQKDIIILENLLDAAQGQRMRYIPLDKSYSMMSDAINDVLKFFSAQSGRANWEVTAILGDILAIERYKSIIYKGNNPKLYGLLGSTIGNFNETQVLSRLVNIMQDSDVLMLGADLIGGRNDKELGLGYDIDAVRELIIHPIIEHLSTLDRNLADSFRDATIHTDILPFVSKVPNSKTVQVYLLDKRGNKYYHFFSTKYDLPSLKGYLTKTVGFRIIKTYTWIDQKTKKERYAKFLLRKKSHY